MTRYGANVIPVPNQYLTDFRRDPNSALLQFGSQPQRAKQPWFGDAIAIDAAMVLPDQVVGPRSEPVARTDPPARCLVAARDIRALIDGLSDTFRPAPGDTTFWHCHVDLALNSDRTGDRAGLAMGRITHTELERGEDVIGQRYERVLRTFEVPLATQIAAPPSSQIQVPAIVRLILMLKQERGFNISSVSMDGYQSASSLQQLVWAGIATAGMRVEPNGELTGIPKPFSVDRTAQPYTDLLEAVNDRRIAVPRYTVLRTELRGLERPLIPGNAPDHSDGSSKDVADAVAGVIGYLTAYGHTELLLDAPVYDRDDFERELGWEEPIQFGPKGDWASGGPDGDDVTFGVE